MTLTFNSVRGLALGALAIAGLSVAAPASASEVGKNTFLGGAAGAVAGGLLSHGSPVGIIAGGAGGALLGHTLSPRGHRYRHYGYNRRHSYYRRGY